MSRIEEDIDNIIYEYFKPKEKHLFRKLMLNTSIITTSAKIKIISNFPNIDHVIINKFQRVLSIRNCFAHLPIQRVLQINFSRDSRSVNEVKSIQNIEYMNSSGKLITKSLTKLIDEFFELEKGIKEDILKFKL